MSDEDRLDAWFEYLGDTYTPESFDEAMKKCDRGEDPPRPGQVRSDAPQMSKPVKGMKK